MMKAERIEEIADLFKALSEPTRLSLLFELKEKEMTVTQLSEFSGTSMANVSKHLAFMKRAGIVSRRKSGNLVYYTLRNQVILDICSLVCNDIESRFTRKPPAATRKSRRPSSTASVLGKGDAGHAQSKEDITIEQPRLKGLNGSLS